MLKVRLHPQWELRNQAGEEVDQYCLPLLLAIEEAGTLSRAAGQVGISYRHAWNLLKRWEAWFGAALVSLERGRGAGLTPLGTRLIRADQRVRARLTPQLISLAAEAETELNRLLEGPATLLRVHASHGFAIAKLRERLEQHHQVRWELQFRSRVDAVASLAQANCEVAGFHVPCGPFAEEAISQYQPWLNGHQRVLPFVIRTQGLILPAGNPQRIRSLTDLRRAGMRFVNRQSGSGTRALLDRLLADQGVSSTELNGYHHEEFTHSAVAAFVASGMAEAGFGVETAAREFGLDFLPLAHEHYSLLCWEDFLDSEPADTLLALLGSEEFQHDVNAMPGYRCYHAGEVFTLDRALVLWRES
ncbi:MAG: helix-turn-helix transcriptional regulator [Ectothiorhodospiraceae bacterium]|nr:helix-turn-helix transcriptional regulator [Ectothiorhodospiraceae bacterium]MCH8503794.1 helix-turn-helix transcriptional regulator [Ectothiorhodospiraceae bacterium]